MLLEMKFSARSLPLNYLNHSNITFFSAVGINGQRSD